MFGIRTSNEPCVAIKVIKLYIKLHGDLSRAMFDTARVIPVKHVQHHTHILPRDKFTDYDSSEISSEIPLVEIG